MALLDYLKKTKNIYPKKDPDFYCFIRCKYKDGCAWGAVCNMCEAIASTKCKRYIEIKIFEGKIMICKFNKECNLINYCNVSESEARETCPTYKKRTGWKECKQCHTYYPPIIFRKSNKNPNKTSNTCEICIIKNQYKRKK